MLIKQYLIAGAALFALVAGVAIQNGVAEEGKAIAPQQQITIAGRKPARFDHQKHLALGMKCAVCHHDKNHNGLTAEAIKAMADKKGLECVGCHNKNFPNANLRKPMDVFHARCRECHKAGYHGKIGPRSCRACHIQKERRRLEGC